jgi:hypothetical protein
MNLSKILDLVKNKHKNISRKANVFTLDEARKLNDKYPYAIVNAYTGRPVYLCEDKESANMMWNKMFRCCATTPLIVDLRNSEEKPMKICEVVRLCKIYGYQSHVCFDRGKKPRVAPERSDLSSHWQNMTVS